MNPLSSWVLVLSVCGLAGILVAGVAVWACCVMAGQSARRARKGGCL